MTPKKIALRIATLFFLFWMVVLYAGADHPTPPGFLGIILADFICAGIVFLRIPAYLQWALERKKSRWWCAMLDGLTAGLVIALVFMLIGNGEPTVQPTILDRVIWALVLSSVGLVNSTGIFLACEWLAGRLKKPV